MAQAWLDIDTYGLPPVAEQIARVECDISRRSSASRRLDSFDDGAFASVVVGNSEV